MEQHDNDQVAQRKRKLAELRAAGIDPYPHRWDPRDTAARLLFEAEPLDGPALEAAERAARVAGRVLALRSFGKTVFVQLQDATGRIQAYCKRDALPLAAWAVVERLDIGDLLGVAGRLFRTRTGEITVQVAELALLAKSLRPLPEKWHGLRDAVARYRQRYLDLIVNPQVREVFRTRAHIVQTVREIFTARGFLEVETPMMQPKGERQGDT